MDDSLSNVRLDQYLIDSLTDHAVFGISTDGTILTWNRGAQRTFGYLPEEVLGKPFTIIFTDDDASKGAPQMELAQALSGQRAQHDRWHVRKDATSFWGTNTVQPVYDPAGSLLGYTKLIADTTASHLAELQLRDSEQRHRLLVESVQHFAIFALSIDGIVESWPPAAENVFGYRPEEMLGQSSSKLFAAPNTEAHAPGAYLHEASVSGSTTIDTWFNRKDGSRFLGSGKLCRLHSDGEADVRGYVQIVHDVTDRDAAQHELRRRAESDDLTALPNRRTFFDFVERSIALSKRKSSFHFAVLFMDLDHFKRVNDQYGHAVADELLKETARRLNHCMRSEDVAARIGGDEFAVLLNGISNAKEADDAAERIADAMRETIVIRGFEVGATVSIGIALGSPECESPEDILRLADIAMYAAKQAGRSRVTRFEAGMLNHASSSGRDDVRAAIINGEMRVHFQPVMRLKENALAGYEALIRWQHPMRGLLQPLDFVPLAERSDTIFAIDRFMIKEALRQLGEWHQESLDASLQMSVNISGRELSRNGFFDELSELVTASGVAANRLRLEITEGASMERSTAARAMIAAIRSLGISIDIDDFGTGYSSLRGLQHIEVDALKIDSSFVASVGSVATVLLDAVIDLAHNLGTMAIAEGIETNEQLAYLISVGCEQGQGFLFSAPLDGPAARRYAKSIASGAPPP